MIYFLFMNNYQDINTNLSYMFHLLLKLQNKVINKLKYCYIFYIFPSNNLEYMYYPLQTYLLFHLYNHLHNNIIFILMYHLQISYQDINLHSYMIHYLFNNLTIHKFHNNNIPLSIKLLIYNHLYMNYYLLQYVILEIYIMKHTNLYQ